MQTSAACLQNVLVGIKYAVPRTPDPEPGASSFKERARDIDSSHFGIHSLLSQTVPYVLDILQQFLPEGGVDLDPGTLYAQVIQVLQD